MGYRLSFYVSDIKSINREIIVSGDLPILLFVKSMILSMNGSTKELFLLCDNDDVIDFNDKDKLSSLNFKVGDTYSIEYDYDGKFWYLDFEVLEEINDFDEKFEIVSGIGYGICLTEDMFTIRGLLTSKNKKWVEGYLSYSKLLTKYFYSKFSLEESNIKIKEYISSNEDVFSTKSYVMNISLNGFTKEIKRKVIVNSDISIDKFCRAVIASMRGDLDHLYGIKFGKKWYGENILDEKLYFLELKSKDKFQVIYDFGDNWVFNVGVSKVTIGNHDKEFEVIDGKGYGIVDDVGGVYNLSSVFDGTNEYFDSKDIKDFDLNEIQNEIDMELR